MEVVAVGHHEGGRQVGIAAGVQQTLDVRQDLAVPRVCAVTSSNDSVENLGIGRYFHIFLERTNYGFNVARSIAELSFH